MWPSKPIEAPAFFSLLVFLGINYLVGYEIGRLLTGSTVSAIALALVTPCFNLLGLALIDGHHMQDGPLESA